MSTIYISIPDWFLILICVLGVVNIVLDIIKIRQTNKIEKLKILTNRGDK